MLTNALKNLMTGRCEEIDNRKGLSWKRKMTLATDIHAAGGTAYWYG
jgi:hypothetical protein